MSSAIKTPAFQAKASNILNEDDSSIYSAGEWSFKNASAVTGFHVDADGKVGIGTTSPAGKVYIAGPNTSSLGVAASNMLNLAAAGGALLGRRVNLGFAVVASAVNNAAAIAFEYTDQSNFGKGDLLFATRSVNTDTAPTERMRIDANGILFIGKSSPSGSTPGNHFGSLNNGTGGAAYNETVSTDTQNFAVWYINRQSLDGSIFEFRRNNVKKGSITINSTSVVYNTSPSDYRLKEQVQDLNGGLEKVKQLRPVSFKWKESGKEDFGFIAHEIASVIPECVTGDKDAVDAEGKPEYQSIFPAPAQMIASLVSAIQEQQAMIEELKAKVSALESK